MDRSTSFTPVQYSKCLSFGVTVNSCALCPIPQSLFHICCDETCADAQTLTHLIRMRPRVQICQYLLACAIDKMLYPSVQVVLCDWPYPSLSLSESCSSCVWNGGTSSIDHQAWAVYSIVRAFMYSLESRTNSGLKHLDLRGFVLSGPVVPYLSIHGSLAHNEDRRRQILEIVRRAKAACKLSDLEAAQFGDLDPTPTLPKGTHSLTVDLSIDCDDMEELSQLCAALKVSKKVGQQNCQQSLAIHVNKIALSSALVEHLQLVIPLLEPQHLVGLSLRLCPLGVSNVSHLLRLGQTISVLNNLVALELDTCRLGIGQDELHEDFVAQILVSLPNLTRLSLKNAAIKGRLRSLLLRCCRPLQFLSLSGSQLSLSDLVYLSQCDHINTLEWLDLSTNALLSSNMNITSHLLANAFNLQHLDISCCAFDQRHLPALVQGFLQCSNLVTLNLEVLQNVFVRSEATIIECVTGLSFHATLECMSMTPSVDVALDDPALLHFPRDQQILLKCETLLGGLNKICLQNKLASRVEALNVVFTEIPTSFIDRVVMNLVDF